MTAINSQLNRNKTLVIKDNSYDITYPNTGQAIDIELLKAKMTDGNYDALRFGGSKAAQEQADVVDMIATFNTLIPQLKEDLNVKSLYHLTEEQSGVLVEVYKEQFLTWYLPIKEAIRNPKKVAETDKNEK